MRVKVFLFAAITAALALPIWARGQRLEKPPVEPDAEDVKGLSTSRRPAYDGYGFAPRLEPNARDWKKSWRAERRVERRLARREQNLSPAAALTAKETDAVAKRRSVDELPPYWSFAEPGFSPPWLTEPIPAAVDAPRA
jgi:hypothetical protein